MKALPNAYIKKVNKHIPFRALSDTAGKVLFSL